MRDAGNYGAPLKLNKMIEGLDKVNTDFALFGGEALLTPLETLDKLFAYGFRRFQKNGIQTNGLLINVDHIAMFKKYNVYIGISIDGTEECNTPRCNAADTRKTIDNILWCLKEGLNTGLIVTIHKTNVRYMDDLLRFFDLMGNAGMQYINLHNLEDDNSTNEVLSNDDNYEAFRTIFEYAQTSKVKFQPFSDIVALLTEENPRNTSCIWNACDALTTAAVHGIGPEGELVNCGRVNKEGIDWIKSSKPGRERYSVLYRTSQEHGGCKDCKYFFACKGNCPGTAIDGDWRNRTKDCSFWYRLIEYIEKDLVANGAKLISDEDKFKLGEKLAIGADTHGDSPHGDSHGDHTDTSKRIRQNELGIYARTGNMGADIQRVL